MEKRIEHIVLGIFVVVTILIFVSWFVIFFFPVRTLPLKLTHDGSSHKIIFSPDGTILATGEYNDGGVILWDVATGDKIRTLGAGRTVQSIAFSPDGSLLAATDYGNRIYVWNVTTGNNIRSFGNASFVYSIDFSPDGTMVVTRGDYGNGVLFWNLTTGDIIGTIGVGISVQSMVFSPDGSLLATCVYDSGGGILWNTSTGVLIRTYRAGQYGYTIDFSPDGTILATGTEDGIVFLDVATGNKIRTFRIANYVHSIDFSPDGTMFAIGTDNGDGGILWNTTTGNEIRGLGGDNWVSSVVFSPDGTLLATVDHDASAVLWNLNESFEISVINQVARDNVILYTITLIIFLIVVEFGLITFSMYKETQETQRLTEVALELRKLDNTLIIRLTAILLIYGGGITFLYGLHELLLFPTYKFNLWSGLGPFNIMLYFPAILIILILGVLTIRRGFRLWSLENFHRIIAFVTVFSIFFLFVSLYALFILPRGGGTFYASSANILTILVILSVVFIILRRNSNYFVNVTQQKNQ
ncbi:MAG: WD40 repeat domain-containing protein [Candidatus Hodarchaeales archaeon]|jgi:sugar lactone lactonase YvrE